MLPSIPFVTVELFGIWAPYTPEWIVFQLLGRGKAASRLRMLQLWRPSLSRLNMASI